MAKSHPLMNMLLVAAIALLVLMVLSRSIRRDVRRDVRDVAADIKHETYSPTYQAILEATAADYMPIEGHGGNLANIILAHQHQLELSNSLNRRHLRHEDRASHVLPAKGGIHHVVGNRVPTPVGGKKMPVQVGILHPASGSPLPVYA